MMKKAMLAVMALAAAALLVGFSMSNAMATQANDTMQVTATVVTVCSLDAPDLDFGEYTGAEIAKDSVWTLLCSTSGTKIASWTWGFGSNYANGTWNMKKTDSEDLLAYRANNGWEPWNPTDASGVTTFTLHMLLAGGQIRPAGSYADTLFVHADF